MPDVSYECGGQIARISLARSRENSGRALAAGIVEAQNRTLVRAVVISGTGEAFSRCCEPAALAALVSAPSCGRSAAPLQGAGRAGVPVIAEVRGSIIGPACDLVLCASMVVIEAKARIGYLAGSGPGMLLWCYRVSYPAAEALLAADRPVGGATAKAMGLVDRAVAEHEVRGEARRLTERFCSRPPEPPRAHHRSGQPPILQTA